MKEPEREVWEDALNLYTIYSDKDLEHNAHGIFQMAIVACQALILKHRTSLALHLEQALVDHFVRRWEENNQSNKPSAAVDLA